MRRLIYYSLGKNSLSKCGQAMAKTTRSHVYFTGSYWRQSSAGICLMDYVILINWTCPFPISNFRGVCCHYSFLFHFDWNVCMQTVQTLIRSDLDLQCLPRFPKRDTRLIRSIYFAGCGLRAAGHFLFPLSDFDFGTSLVCSFIVLKANMGK